MRAASSARPRARRGKGAPAMRLSYDLPFRAARLTFALLMLLAWSGIPQLSLAAPAAATGGARQRAAELNEQLQRAEQILREQRRDAFDGDALVAKIGKDVDRIFGWVW